MNVGILGGTFDPIHNGHLAVAEEVRVQLHLTEVVFIPAGKPWHRSRSPLASAEHRVRMILLAIADNDYFKLSTIEVEREGPTYTVDTFEELRGQLGVENKLFFIVGWDSLAELPHWKEPDRLVKMCQLVTVPRPGYPQPELKALEERIPDLSVTFLDKPVIDISATQIRERVTRGLSVHHLVPEAVEEYIKENKLYTSA
jgi:nicotinate-nucleotide adenylyltransferase